MTVFVDIGSRKIDAEPLKNKESQTVLDALLKIYKRGILKTPSYQIQVDPGTEFKGAFEKYWKKKGLNIRVGQTGRHRQQGLIERMNQSIAKPLLMRQIAEELITNEPSYEWTEFLPDVIKYLNKKYEVKKFENDKHPDYKKIFADVRCEGKSCEVMPNGTSVRYQLDEPINHLTGHKLHGNFRSADIRWSVKPTTIERCQLMPNQPILYKIKGKTALYTRNQLQIVNVKSELPPDTIQKKFIIEEILEKKKIKNKIMYLILWKGYKDATWEPRTEIIKDVPEMINTFEESLKKKNQL